MNNGTSTGKALRQTDSIVLVHDYLTQRGGAERVALSMLRAFPGAPLITSLYEPRQTYPEFRSRPVQTLPLNRVGTLRRHHRLALPLLASAFSGFRTTADVVVCSSSGWAHGVRTEGRKVVYCHTPARWLYQSDQYLPGHGLPAKWALHALRAPLQQWDRRAATTADRYLVNSRLIRGRVRQIYGIDAEVLPPPHTIDVTASQLPVDSVEPGYYLAVARLNGYKNVASIVDAFGELPRERLVVAGSGHERRRLEERAAANVRFIGSVSDDQLRWLYANCRALVAASYEDFGLTPLECAAFGRPAVALRWGGYLDTVVDGQTGVFFAVPDAPAIRAAVRRLEKESIDEAILKKHADRYSEAVFIEEFRQRALEP